MYYIPLVLMFISLGLVFRRPGFLLGCVFCIFQYEALYALPTAVGVVALMGFLTLAFCFVLWRGRMPIFTGLDGALVFFAFIYLLSTLYSRDFGVAIATVARFYAVCLGYYAIGRLLVCQPFCEGRLVADFGVSVVLLSIVFGILAFTSGAFNGRLHLGNASAVGFSQMLDVAGVTCLFYLLSRTERSSLRNKAFVLLALCLVGAVIMLNATRGTVLSLVLAAAAYIFYAVLKGRTSRFYAGLSTLFLVLAVGLFTAQFVGDAAETLEFAWNRLTINFSDTGLVIDRSSGQRILRLNAAWEMFLASPYFGEGAGAYNVHTPYGYPHNIFFEMLADVGLVGAFVLGSVLLVFGQNALQLLQKANFGAEASIVVGIFLVSGAHLQVSMTLWMAKPLFLAMGIIASRQQQFRVQRRRPMSLLNLSRSRSYYL